MTFELKTIADEIDSLARLTGAPSTFVCQVKDLFSRKGIPLDADASPYVRALEEAFKREESIRTSAHRARRNIARLAENFNKIGRGYVRQLEELRRIQAGLRGRTGQGPKKSAASHPRERRRRFMMPRVSDGQLMVPGPEEEQ
jgi:ABC-type transporter Mla subunit MlaD